MKIKFDATDFIELSTHSTKWTAELAEQDGRWELKGATSELADLRIWSHAYWVADWSGVILVRSWLNGLMHAYATLWDIDRLEYVILTNYTTVRGIGESHTAHGEFSASRKTTPGGFSS